MEEWLASVPEWLKATVSILGTIGGIALTYALSRLGVGHGKEKAKEEAAAQGAIPPPIAANANPMPAQLVGIGGTLLERTTAETLIKVGSALSLSVDKLVDSVDRLTVMYGRWIEQMEDAGERERLKQELEREAEMRRVLDELTRLRNERKDGAGKA